MVKVYRKYCIWKKNYYYCYDYVEISHCKFHVFMLTKISFMLFHFIFVSKKGIKNFFISSIFSESILRFLTSFCVFHFVKYIFNSPRLVVVLYTVFILDKGRNNETVFNRSEVSRKGSTFVHTTSSNREWRVWKQIDRGGG